MRNCMLNGEYMEKTMHTCYLVSCGEIIGSKCLANELSQKLARQMGCTMCSNDVKVTNHQHSITKCRKIKLKPFGGIKELFVNFSSHCLLAVSRTSKFVENKSTLLIYSYHLSSIQFRFLIKVYSQRNCNENKLLISPMDVLNCVSS